MTTIKVRSYIINRDNIAYVKECYDNGRKRVVVVFRGNCNDIYFDCDASEQVEELALDIMVTSKLVV